MNWPREGGEWEDEGEEEDELLGRRRIGRVIVRPLGAEEELTAHYSHYSGHAGDKGNSESEDDSGGDHNNNDCIK